MMEGGRQSRGGRSFAKKVLALVSKRKRDEEKKRLDLWRAMRDSSVERLAAVISSARTEFGDKLSDLCTDAERVLQRLLRENAQGMSSSHQQQQPSGTRRKVTLRERLLLADCEPNSNSNNNNNSVVLPESCSSSAAAAAASAENNSTAPMIQAVLTLVRPQSESAPAFTHNSSSTPITLAQQLGGHLEGSNSDNSSGRRLLSALLWEERNVSSSEPSEIGSWLAFGVSVESSAAGGAAAAAATSGSVIHFDHSRSQSLGAELASEAAAAAQHRPTASLDGSGASADAPSRQEAPAPAVPGTPMRVSLMSLLSEAEEATGGGSSSSIIFMNGRLVHHHESLSPPRTSKDQQGLEQMCCVCMGYQKGAAFIPCGHTFCRKCCRELRAARGTCPLCNKEIDDILNLY